MPDLFSPLRVLIAFERSGTVRRAFLARGHDAWSCDTAAAEDQTNRHIRADARTILHDGWDLLIVAHPPCTRLCHSGLRWLHTPPPGRALADMWRELDDAADLFSTFWNAPVPRVAIENPNMHRHAQQRIRGYQPPSQRVQPWMWGDPMFKTICLWLRGLPDLEPVGALTPPAYGTPEAKPWERIHRMPGGKDQARKRATFFPGIADAMADQWGGYALAEMGIAA